MKIRVSATIEEGTGEILNEIVEKGRYRNKSHAIEEMIKNIWEEKYAKNKK
jgi:Arc/MetJ-type ribon-helix-helix transcriptional regulator